MTSRPYPMMRNIGITHSPPSGHIVEWRYEVELSDTANVSARREQLTILTHVQGPIPDHPEGLHLAALEHVRALLDAQIKVMRNKP